MLLLVLSLILLGVCGFAVGMRPRRQNQPLLPLALLFAFFSGPVLLSLWLVLLDEDAWASWMFVWDFQGMEAGVLYIFCLMVSVGGAFLLVPSWAYVIGRFVASRSMRKSLVIGSKTSIDDW